MSTNAAHEPTFYIQAPGESAEEYQARLLAAPVQDLAPAEDHDEDDGQWGDLYSMVDYRDPEESGKPSVASIEDAPVDDGQWAHLLAGPEWTEDSEDAEARVPILTTEVEAETAVEPAAVRMAGESFDTEPEQIQDTTTSTNTPARLTGKHPYTADQARPDKQERGVQVGNGIEITRQGFLDSLTGPLAHWDTAGKPLGKRWELKHYAAGDNISGLRSASGLKVVDSAVAPLVAAAQGLETVEDEPALKKATDRYGLPKGNTAQGKRMRAALGRADILIMPHYTPQGLATAERSGDAPKPGTVQYRPSDPEKNERTGKERKYEVAVGSQTPLSVPPSTPQSWIDEAPVIVLAEGLLKMLSGFTAYLDSLVVRGILSTDDIDLGEGGAGARNRLRAAMEKVPVDERVLFMSVVGVGNWKKNPEWRSLLFKDRVVLIGFDGDIAANPDVWRNADEMRKYLEESHRVADVYVMAAQVQTTRYSASNDAENTLVEKVGMDDYLAAHGDWGSLIKTCLSPDLPERPYRADQSDRLQGVGESRIITKPGVTLREVMRSQSIRPGVRETFTETARVLNVSFTPIASETYVPGFPRRGDRNITSWDLRVFATHGDGTLASADVLVWRNDRLHELEAILEQGGVQVMQGSWFVSPTESLRREIAQSIRSQSSEHLPHYTALGRLGYLPLLNTPDLAERNADETMSDAVPAHAWGLVSDKGGIVAEQYVTPLLRAEVGDVGLSTKDLPEWQPLGDKMDDLETLLTVIVEAFNDPTALYLGLTKFAQARSGGRPRGSLMISGNRGRGKSEWLKAINALMFGGDPTSADNSTGLSVAGLPDDRSHTVTIIDDFRRGEEDDGDDKDFPILKRNIGTALRRGYDGPEAARLRQGEKGGKGSGEYAARGVNQAWPTVIVGSELKSDFKSSTMFRHLGYWCADDFIVEGAAADVIGVHKDEGLFDRIGRAYVEWVLSQIPGWIGGDNVQSVDALEAYWMGKHRDAFKVTRRNAEGEVVTERAELHTVVSASCESESLSGLTDEQRQTMAAWPESRSREVFAGFMLGLRLLDEWMNALVTAAESRGIELPGSIKGVVEDFIDDGASHMFEAMALHVQACGEDESHMVHDTTLAKIKDLLSDNSIAFYNPLDGLTDEQERLRSTVVGKEYDADLVNVQMDKMADAVGVKVNALRTALRPHAVKNSEGKERWKVTINGVALVPVWRVPLSLFGKRGHNLPLLSARDAQAAAHEADDEADPSLTDYYGDGLDD